MFVLAYLMYYAGQWGGGDSKLIMGLGALIGFELKADSILVLFLIMVIFTGAIYGLIYSLVLALMNRQKFWKKVIELRDKYHGKRRIVILISLLFVVSSFFMEVYLRLIVLITGFVIVIAFYFFLFARAVESACMLKHVEPKRLTEGDWIVHDIKVDGKGYADQRIWVLVKNRSKSWLSLKARKRLIQCL
jgi:amino acid transporter